MSKRYIYKVVVKNGDKVRTVLSVRAIADMRFVKRWYYQIYQQKDGDVFVICSDEEAVWEARRGGKDSKQVFLMGITLLK